jgi:SET domain-containing protein
MPKIFRFVADGEELFNYVLESERCLGNTKNGARCKRKCIIGFEYCPAHLKSTKHLAIKQSTIPNAGQGLFAVNPNVGPNAIVFKRYEKIGDYNGVNKTQAELNEDYRDYTAPYAVTVSKNRIIDSAGRRGYGSLANHKDNNNNADLISDNRNHKVILRATKDIRNNQEIFVNYGDEYDFDEEGVQYSTKPYYPK